MKSRKNLSTLLGITAILLLSITAMWVLSAVPVTQAQGGGQNTFSGRAVGIDADTRVTTVAGTTVTAEVLLADTGALPPAGGQLFGGVVSANVTTLGLLTSNFMTGVIQTTTSGGGNMSQSQATVNSLNLAVAGATISATTLRANSECTCNGTTPVCSGSTVVENLVITRPGLATITLNGAVAPNTVIESSATVVVPLVTSTTTTTRIVVNEQITGPGSITVNALHVTVTATVTDLLTGLVTTTTTTDIIVAQAHSDITCGAGPPTAAPVSITGRVLNSRGRGIFNAIVTLTDPSGQERFSISNPFGYYRFDEVAVGDTYVLEVISKRYTFLPKVISVTEELTELNFVADQ